MKKIYHFNLSIEIMDNFKEVLKAKFGKIWGNISFQVEQLLKKFIEEEQEGSK
jgi:hypothetical protein